MISFFAESRGLFLRSIGRVDVEELLAVGDVLCVAEQAAVPVRMLDLMSSFELGRRRILDTALAATLEAAGVRRLATFNGADFKVFGFIEIIDPRRR